MSQSSKLPNTEGHGDKSTDKKTRFINRMIQAFPRCPMCSSEADYEFKGLGAACRNCKARWKSKELNADTELKTLELLMTGKTSKGGKLKRWPKTVAFWQSFNAEEWRKNYERDLNQLLNTICGPDQDAGSRAFEELQAYGDMGLALIRGNADGSHHTLYRKHAFRYLERLGDERDLPLLIQALEDEDLEVQKLAIESLANFAAEHQIHGAVLPLGEALRSATDPAVRQHAAFFMRRIKGNKQVVEALAEALKDLGRPESKPIVAITLAGMLREAARARVPWSVRDTAAWSLAELHDPQATKLVVEFMLVEGLGYSFAIDAELIQTIGEPAIDLLMDGLTSDDERSRARAAGFLGFLDNNRSVDSLIALVSDENALVRRNAIASLARLGDGRAIEPIRAACNDVDSETAKAARQSLKTLGG